MSEQTPASADPRVDLARHQTNMASYRTQLAMDRTTLAWVRTTLTMASFGFGMVAFFRTIREQSPTPENIRLHEGAIRLGTGLILVGIVGAILAGFTHWRSLRKLNRGESPDLNRWPVSIAIVVLIAVFGLAELWAIFVQ
jgi:uncharacterized membrane protein YidH (DUF202 family)